MRKLISFDLDMTLLNHYTYRIPDSALEALEGLRSQGHVIALATGRDMDNHYSREFRDLVNPDAIIHLNGTKITVGDQVLHDHHMDCDLLTRLLAFAEEKELSIGVTLGDDDYYVNSRQVELMDIARWGESGRQFKDTSELLDMGVRTMAYVGNPEGANKIREAFPEVRVLMFAGMQGADIIEADTSKAIGLERLVEYFEIPMEDTIAFGDSMNDYEIIKAAGIGIAMGNAIEPVKQVADYVTADIGEHGILKACQHFKLL